MAVCQQEVVLQREPFPSTPDLSHSFAVEPSIFKLFKEEAAIFFLIKKIFLYLRFPLDIFIYIYIYQFVS